MKPISTNKAFGTLILVGGLIFGSLTFAYSDSRGEQKCSSGPDHHRWSDNHKRHHGGPMDRVKYLLRKLDLSSEQREEVDTILEAAKPEFKANIKAMRANHHQLHSLIRGDHVDQQNIQTTADAQGELASNLTMLSARVHTDIFKVLTEEQREKAQQIIAQKHERHKKHH